MKLVEHCDQTEEERVVVVRKEPKAMLLLEAVRVPLRNDERGFCALLFLSVDGSTERVQKQRSEADRGVRDRSKVRAQKECKDSDRDS